MGRHLEFFHQCEYCEAAYIPFSKIPCPRCGIVESKRSDFIEKATDIAKQNLAEFKRFTPEACVGKSLGDFILRITLEILERVRLSPHLTCERVAREYVAQIDFGNDKYLGAHIEEVANLIDSAVTPRGTILINRVCPSEPQRDFKREAMITRTTNAINAAIRGRKEHFNLGVNPVYAERIADTFSTKCQIRRAPSLSAGEFITALALSDDRAFALVIDASTIVGKTLQGKHHTWSSSGYYWGMRETEVLKAFTGHCRNSAFVLFLDGLEETELLAQILIPRGK